MSWYMAPAALIWTVEEGLKKVRESTVQFSDEETLLERIEAYAAHNKISVNHAIHRLLIEGWQAPDSLIS